MGGGGVNELMNVSFKFILKRDIAIFTSRREQVRKIDTSFEI